MRKIFANVRLSLTSAIAFAVLGIATLLVATVIAVVKHESDTAALETSGTLFKEISAKTIANIHVILESISTLTDTGALAVTQRPRQAQAGASPGQMRAFKSMLDSNGQLMSVYAGYEDGAFHQLMATRGNPALMEKYGAPPGTAYINRTILPSPGGDGEQSWLFLDGGFARLSERVDAHAGYDPRKRPWYVRARGVPASVFTEPYVFSSSGLPGITCARRLPGEEGVFGVDVTLEQLGGVLAGQKVAESGSIWIVDGGNRLVASPGMAWQRPSGDGLDLPLAVNAAQTVIRAVASQADPSAASGERFTVEASGEKYLASLTPLPQEHGLKLVVAVAAPFSDITGNIGRMALRIVLISAGVLLLTAPLAIAVARSASSAVKGLVVEAGKIERFDFSPSPPVQTHITEVRELARACEVMKDTIQTRTENLESTRVMLEKLVQGGLALSAEKELKTLMTLIFRTAQDLAGADGGVMYLMENGQLEVELLSLGSESLVLGGLSENPAPRVMVQPSIMAFLSKDSVLRSACEAFNTREIVIARDVELSLFPTGLPEEPKDYPIRSVIAVPIVTRRDELLGVIQLFNPERGDGAIGLIGSLAAQAAVTLDNRNLVESLKKLFDALIQVMASSIDAKSPYTAGHCTRVPVLAEMLARAAHDAQEGPLKDFRMESEDEWRQLWIAAWLHDCGKVTTPEYIVDKATKLETIYNRIHEVRMRFEVLRRDAEIDHLRRLALGNEDAGALERELRETLQSLEDDFAFLAKCNAGGEFMSEEDKERVRRIAGRTWTRHFNDRLGLSAEESRAKGDGPEPELPAREPLLADKAEHVSPRLKDYAHLQDAQGRPVRAPDSEYNRGEVYNLCIPRGTLTPEDRFKINEHTLSGLEMLGKIPFPESLARVTEIATSHHETLAGTGYPLGKNGDQIAIESRILAIADVFEALTASDRPYKKAKTVSEALRIMSFMRKDRHIDADLFEVFLEKGVFLSYARQHLSPDQIDIEDAGPYLNKRA